MQIWTYYYSKYENSIFHLGDSSSVQNTLTGGVGAISTPGKHHWKKQTISNFSFGIQALPQGEDEERWMDTASTQIRKLSKHFRELATYDTKLSVCLRKALWAFGKTWNRLGHFKSLWDVFNLDDSLWGVQHRGNSLKCLNIIYLCKGS